MAKRKVYFYRVDFSRNGRIVENDEFRNKFIEAVNNKGGLKKGKYTINLTQKGDDAHVCADIYEYKNTSILLRLSKQKAKGAYIERDYETLADAPLLSNYKGDKGGLEVYTFAYYRYNERSS